MNQGEALFKLQQMDRERTQHEKRLQAIQAELEDNAVVQAARQRLEAAENALKPLQTELRDLELQNQTTQTKHQATEQRLYSGAVTNPRELQEMQEEIASLQRLQAQLEEAIIERMMQVEAAQAEREARQTELAQTIQAAEADHLDLREERAKLQSKLRRLTEDRDKQARMVSAANLELYESLRPKKGHRPVSKLSDGNCSLCGVGQNMATIKQIKQGGALVMCNNCGRILVHMP